MTNAAQIRKGPILVTGSHRSGSTWVGRTLASAPRTFYLNEPFNLERRSPERGFDPGLWFLAVDAESPRALRRAAASTLTGFAYWKKLPPEAGLRERLRWRAIHAVKRLRGDRIVYKDPIAFFSTEWMADELGMIPVVTIRHPAAFCSSLKLKGWAFDFRNFTAQPRLMQGALAPWAEEIERAAAEPPDIVGQGILLWNCIYGIVDRWRRERPDWLYATHEDLSLDPVGGFRALFEALGLEFGPAQIAHLEEVSGGSNPSEQTQDEFRRDARANVDNWKRRLEPAEIDRVMKATETLRPRFYPD